MIDQSAATERSEKWATAKLRILEEIYIDIFCKKVTEKLLESADFRRMASTSSYSNPPCAACKFLRRKCLSGCIFAPYFPPEEPTKFANVHKIFGASNVSKLLNEIPPHQREDAVISLAYEAEARLKDPVYGCVGAISVLQRQVVHLQKELDATNTDLMRYATNENTSNFNHNPMFSHMQNNRPKNKNNNNTGQRNKDYGAPGGSSFDPNSGFCFPYPSPWIDNPSGENIHDGGGHGSC